MAPRDRRIFPPQGEAAVILYENAPGPAVRSGEFEIAGRRVAARALPYTGDPSGAALQFDPIERRFVSRSESGTILCGPYDPAEWAEQLRRASRGPVLVCGAAPAEAVRGAFRGAAEGARRAGRGAYLLDPTADGLPERVPSRNGSRAESPPFVALFSWSPLAGPDLDALSAAREAGIPSGVLWPVIAGWTAGEDFLTPFLATLAAAGASFAAPLAPTDDAEFRRGAVEARIAADPSGAEEFFDTMHHRPWSDGIGADVDRARFAVRSAGLRVMPPRPAGPGEPVANVLAAGALEERALDAGDDHRVSLLYAAVRWIDACGRDLGAVFREGNFALLRPATTCLKFGGRIFRQHC